MKNHICVFWWISSQIPLYIVIVIKLSQREVSILFLGETFGRWKFLVEAFFTWTATTGKILTLDNLRKRNICVVNWCCLCKNSWKSGVHRLIHCTYAWRLWNFVLCLFGVSWVMPKHVVELLGQSHCVSCGPWRDKTNPPLRRRNTQYWICSVFFFCMIGWLWWVFISSLLFSCRVFRFMYFLLILAFPLYMKASMVFFLFFSIKFLIIKKKDGGY